MSRKSIALQVVFCCLFLFTRQGEAELNLADEQLGKLEQKYGEQAGKRFRAWRDLIQKSQSLPEEDKLKEVNNFFNMTVLFVGDADNWGVEDYWATPFECLGKGAGDCEDFSIAKYFTLRELGVPDEKLRLTYVKALAPYNQAHMVCTYFPSPTSSPLVLDNLVGEIEPATNRHDLVPVYSFNGTGLWLAKARGTGQEVKGGTGRLAMWQQLKDRMGKDKI
jgi:predicted transglutaminase-like cysteine proteinase